MQIDTRKTEKSEHPQICVHFARRYGVYNNFQGRCFVFRGYSNSTLMLKLMFKER